MGLEIHALAELLNQITDVLGGLTETMAAVKDAAMTRDGVNIE